jgi:hypothetical protein
MTESLVQSPSGPQWQAFVQTLFDTGAGNTAEVAAQAALRLIAIADCDISGCVFDVDTSTELIAQHKAEIRHRQLYVMRMQNL